MGINPSVTLWNPYDKSMRINDLFVEIPFAQEGGRYEPFECSVTQVDFREYDLYRKWWAYMYGDFNASFQLKDSSIPSPFIVNITAEKSKTGRNLGAFIIFSQGPILMVNQNRTRFVDNF